MSWIILIIAGLFEVAMALALNASQGFSRLVPSVLFLVTGGISFCLLSLALKNIPVGTAYAVWTGIGASGAVLFGILFFKEPAGLLRIAGVLVVLSGVVMLRLAEG